MEESGGDSHLLLGLATGSGLGGLGGLGLGGFRGLWIGWGGGAQVSHRDRGAKNPSGSFSAQPRPEMRGVEGLANPLRAHPTADGSGTIVRYGRGAHHLRRYSPSSCKEVVTCRDPGLLFEASGLHVSDRQCWDGCKKTTVRRRRRIDGRRRNAFHAVPASSSFPPHSTARPRDRERTPSTHTPPRSCQPPTSAPRSRAPRAAPSTPRDAARPSPSSSRCSPR